MAPRLPYRVPVVVGCALLAACTTDANLGWSDDGEVTVTETEHDIATQSGFEEHIVDGAVQCDSLAVADIDGDGSADLVGAVSGEYSIVWWENGQGNGEQWIRRPVTSDFCGAIHVDIADMDGDGDPDILASSFFTGNCDAPHGTAWFENRVAARAPWVKHPVEGDEKQMLSSPADVDGDGDPDVMATFVTNGDGVLAWWENSDNGRHWKRRTVTEGLFLGIPDAADLDGDDDMDLIAVPGSVSTFGWYENSDRVSWRSHPLASETDNPYTLILFDVDGDTDIDMFTSDYNGQVFWWENIDRAADWERHEIGAGQSIYLPPNGYGDFNGDGIGDAVGLAVDDADVVRFDNVSGDGSTWSTQVIAAAFDGSALAVGEMNGDGRVDVVGAARRLDLVVWWASK